MATGGISAGSGRLRLVQAEGERQPVAGVVARDLPAASEKNAGEGGEDQAKLKSLKSSASSSEFQISGSRSKIGGDAEYFFMAASGSGRISSVGRRGDHDYLRVRLAVRRDIGAGAEQRQGDECFRRGFGAGGAGLGG
jgi:hypothetical protein